MRLAIRIVWTNTERTRGKVLLFWRCDEHNMETRVGDLGDPPPPCPGCNGYHFQVVKQKPALSA